MGEGKCQLILVTVLLLIIVSAGCLMHNPMPTFTPICYLSLAETATGIHVLLAPLHHSTCTTKLLSTRNKLKCHTLKRIFPIKR